MFSPVIACITSCQIPSLSKANVPEVTSLAYPVCACCVSSGLIKGVLSPRLPNITQYMSRAVVSITVYRRRFDFSLKSLFIWTVYSREGTEYVWWQHNIEYG